MHEDFAANFVPRCAIEYRGRCSLLISAFNPRRQKNIRELQSRRDVCAHTVCVLAGFVLFCYYFKWQVWNTRLQLTLFVLFAPVVGTVLFPSSHRLLAAVAIAVGVLGLPWTFGNMTRPLNFSVLSATGDRTERYFANRPDLLPTFLSLTEAIAQTSCGRIGLRISTDPFEYPLWVLLRDRDLRPTIKHVESHGLAAVPLDTGFQPCAVISAGIDERSSHLTQRQFGGFYLYVEPAAVQRPGS